jgi:pSer/pThr/pTyr-binding forkhead associated (FHA) protein
MEVTQVVMNFNPLKNSFSTGRVVTLKENHSVDIGRLVEGTEQSSNLKFVSKVVSRAHAKIAYMSGKVR